MGLILMVLVLFMNKTIPLNINFAQSNHNHRQKNVFSLCFLLITVTEKDV